MEGVLQEAKTVSAINYTDRFFASVPSDGRYSTTQWHKIIPVNGSGRELTSFSFVLPRMDAPNVYLVIFIVNNFTNFTVHCSSTYLQIYKNIFQISNVMIQASIIIVKENKKDVPNIKACVAPVNNALQSAFSHLKTSINDNPLTQNPANYPYK